MSLLRHNTSSAEPERMLELIRNNKIIFLYYQISMMRFDSL